MGQALLSVIPFCQLWTPCQAHTFADNDLCTPSNWAGPSQPRWCLPLGVWSHLFLFCSWERCRIPSEGDRKGSKHMWKKKHNNYMYNLCNVWSGASCALSSMKMKALSFIRNLLITLWARCAAVWLGHYIGSKSSYMYFCFPSPYTVLGNALSHSQQGSSQMRLWACNMNYNAVVSFLIAVEGQQNKTGHEGWGQLQRYCPCRGFASDHMNPYILMYSILGRKKIFIGSSFNESDFSI